jgi:mannose-6-phosphate isomerase-like protein (cupin superfamily)
MHRRIRMSVWTPGSVRGDPGPVSYAEFLRIEALSAGFYRLEEGATDPQEPHREDEVYCVISGRARLRIGEELFDIGPGSTAFVPAHASHRFESITEALELLVVFAPPETAAE